MGNYKSIAIQELIKFTKDNEEYTLAETLYSFLRPSILDKRQEELNWLRTVTDKEIYEAIETANRYENE